MICRVTQQEPEKWNLGPGTCTGRTPGPRTQNLKMPRLDPGPESIQVGPGNREPINGTREPGMEK